MIHFWQVKINGCATADITMAMTKTPEQQELAELIVSTLNLEGVDPANIDPEAALFGSGLALDSIDALELALEIGKRLRRPALSEIGFAPHGQRTRGAAGILIR